MYHGLVASCAETGDLIDGEIFPGASYLGKKALKLTLRVVDRCRGRLCGSMIVRMDAGFPEPGLLQGLESRSVPYIARIRKNEVLNRMAKPYLTQPAGRSPDAPPRLWFHELTYQAESWDRARRVVLVVRERPGELYPDSFLVADEPEPETIRGSGVAGTVSKAGKSGRPHGGVHGRARSGLVLREPAQDALSGQTAEVGSQAGSEDRGRVRPHNEVLFLLNLLGYEILHPGSGVDGAGDASGLESCVVFVSGCCEWRVGRCVRGGD